MPDEQITGKVTLKRYRCTSCGHESMMETNHYGKIWPACSNCSWKYPLEFGQIHDCLEPVPEGWGVPAPWKTVRLGDICTIQEGKKL